jgi:hypothetical protein
LVRIFDGISNPLVTEPTGRLGTESVSKRRDHERTRDFARLRAAHAIGYREQGAAVAELETPGPPWGRRRFVPCQIGRKESVFVLASNAARIRSCGNH